METKTPPMKPEEKIRQELEKRKMADAFIAEIKEQYMVLTVTGPEDKEGLKKVHDARIIVKDARIGVQKYCKAAREEANAYSKAVIAEEKRIVALIEPIESHLEEQESIVEREKERLRQLEEDKEKQRIKDRIAKLLEFKMQYDGTGYKLGDIYINSEVITVMTDERFEEIVTGVKSAYEYMQDKKRQEEALEKAERERLQKIADEQEAERKRLEAIAKEQAQKEATIRAEQEKEAARLKTERDKIEAEKKAIEDGKRKAEEDKQRAIELEAAKKEAAERAIREAEEKAKKEAEEKAEAERQAAMEAARQEALKPDKEKLISFSQSIYDLVANPPELKQEEAKEILQGTLDALKKVASGIIINTKTL